MFINSRFIIGHFRAEVEELYLKMKRENDFEYDRLIDIKQISEQKFIELFADQYGTRTDRFTSRIQDRLLTLLRRDRLDGRQINAIWNLLKNRINRVSLALHWRLPYDYIFYNPQSSESEIINTSNLLADAVEGWVFDGRPISPSNRNRYEVFNEGMQILSRELWPGDLDRPLKIQILIYWCMPELTRGFRNQKRYWLGVVKGDYNQEEILELQEGETIAWSATKEAQIGDIFFAYCSSPHSSVKAVFEVVSDPWCIPYAPQNWRGHFVRLVKLANLELPIKNMRNDPVLGKWSAYRQNFQGLTFGAIPPRIYNRILEVAHFQKELPYLLVKVPESLYLGKGDFASEVEFEIEVILPLLREMGFSKSESQFPCEITVGSQLHLLKIDVLVKDDEGRLVSIIENKKALRGGNAEQRAYDQGRCYALQLGLGSFVVAAPEYIKVYPRTRLRMDFVELDKPSLITTWDRLSESLEERNNFAKTLRSFT